MNRPRRFEGAWAIAEVTLAFAVMHVAFRAFKRFTVLGQFETQNGLNFAPGVAMIIVALAFIAMRRRSPAEFGLTPHPFASSIKAALLCLLILAGCGALALVCGAPFERPPVSFAGTLGPVAVNIGGTLLVLWSLRRFGPAVARTPRWLGYLAVLGVVLLPILAAVAQQRAPGRTVLEVLWLLAGAGVGEEVFFRGYVQSRLNEAFGRPWQVCGVEFGPGLFGAAAFFGLVHVLNRADYFVGVYKFMWWHGFAAASTLFYGFLRERYASVAAPAAVHGLGDLLLRLPLLLRGQV
jgi:membrane protease YdiL (CAAX protease family)